MHITALNRLLNIPEEKDEAMSDKTFQDLLKTGEVAALRREIAKEAIKAEFMPNFSISDESGTRFFNHNREVEMCCVYSWRLKKPTT
jgi:hypothetical protein